jgi:hypothetical protein
VVANDGCDYPADIVFCGFKRQAIYHEPPSVVKHKHCINHFLL